MAQLSPTVPTITDILGRVHEPQDTSFSEEFARFIINCRFPKNDQIRLQELAEKQRVSKLTESEQAEIDCYLKVADLVEVLKAKAAATLSQSNSD